MPIRKTKQVAFENIVQTGNAGGFGGSLLNGSVKNASVTNLNQVNALNYTGGFIGHLGKSGVVDLDKASNRRRTYRLVKCHSRRVG